MCRIWTNMDITWLYMTSKIPEKTSFAHDKYLWQREKDRIDPDLSSWKI